MLNKNDYEKQNLNDILHSPVIEAFVEKRGNIIHDLIGAEYSDNFSSYSRYSHFVDIYDLLIADEVAMLVLTDKNIVSDMSDEKLFKLLDQYVRIKRRRNIGYGLQIYKLKSNAKLIVDYIIEEYYGDIKGEKK